VLDKAIAIAAKKVPTSDVFLVEDIVSNPLR
jgi:hypothetical protein